MITFSSYVLYVNFIVTCLCEHNCIITKTVTYVLIIHPMLNLIYFLKMYTEVIYM